MFITRNDPSSQIFATYGQSKQSTLTAKLGYSYDTVHISDEARGAFEQSKKLTKGQSAPATVSVMEVFKSDEEKEMEKVLSAFFATMYSGSGAVAGLESVPDRDDILPENQDKRDALEKEIKKILGDSGTFVPQEVLDEIHPAWLKLGVISAVGDKMLLSDELLEKGSAFLGKLEAKWMEGKNYGVDTASLFKNSMNNEATYYGDAEEKTQKIKDKILNELTNRLGDEQDNADKIVKDEDENEILDETKK